MGCRDALTQPKSTNPIDHAMSTDRSSYPSLTSSLSLPQPLSHPDRLAAIAILLGRNPVDIRHARILEIGCGAGNHLLPLAVAYPECTVVGIDTDAQAICIALELVDELNLKNAHFSVNQFSAIKKMGRFDYIICHHLYSFLNHKARMRLLDAVAATLNDNGLALISYATYPGWKSREVLRDLLHLHTSLHPDVDQLSIVMPTLDFYRSTLDEHHPLGLLIRENHAAFTPEHRPLLQQYYFNPHNIRPVYFREFADDARKNGLRFLCEAHYACHFQAPIRDEAWQLLQQECGEHCETLEQCADFFTDRSARQSILVKSHGIQSAVKPIIKSDKDRLSRLHIQGIFTFRRVDDEPQEPYWISDINNNIIVKDNPLNQLIFQRINQHNDQSLALSALLTEIHHQFGEAPRILIHTLELLTRLIELEAVQIRLNPVHFAIKIPKYPKLRQFIRIFLKYQKKYPQYCHLSNIWHQPIAPDEAASALLDALNGENTLADLSNVLMALYQNGKIQFYDDRQQAIDTEKDIKAACKQTVHHYLQQFTRWGLLESSGHTKHHN